jgi:hypothetical protein
VHLAIAGCCGSAYTMIKWKLKTQENMYAFQSVPYAIEKFIGPKDSVIFFSSYANLFTISFLIGGVVNESS